MIPVNRFSKVVFVVALLFSRGLVAQPPAAASEPPRDSRVEQILSQLEAVRRPQLAVISPNGRWIGWTLDSGEIDLAPVGKPSDVTKVTACVGDQKGTEDELAWSPDSHRLAFFSDCNTEHRRDLYLAELDSRGALAPPRRVLALHGAGNSLAWSPDGLRIAFLYTQGSEAMAAWTEVLNHQTPTGVIGERQEVSQHLAVWDLASGTLSVVSPPDLHVYEFGWSPDSSRVVYSAAVPPGENNWWTAKMYTQRMSVGPGRSPAPPSILIDPADAHSLLRRLQLAVPHWSPDGDQIAFIAGLMSDRGVTGGDVYVVSANGGIPRKLTPGRKASAASLAWLDGHTLRVAENVGGQSRLFALDVKTLREVAGSGVTLSATLEPLAPRSYFSVAVDGRIGLVMSSFSSAPEVWVEEETHFDRITHYNDAIQPAWGEAESVTWHNQGWEVQGWLVHPRHYDPAKRYPLVVTVHGGPSFIYSPAWPAPYLPEMTLAAFDYFVLLPNPRGSFGQGEKFARANVRDPGRGPLSDILAGVDTVTRKYSIDPKRVGITGWSYGGYLTLFAVTQTNRFRAAVGGGSVSDWQSYYGTNSVQGWMPPFFDATIYDDPAVYARSSPVNFINQAHTPTLIVVGSGDGECPPGQSIEFWSGLRYRKVPTRLVIYPDEGHILLQHDHQVDLLARMVSWFQQYMPESR